MSGLDTEITNAEVAFDNQRLKMPLRISSGLITELTQATASVTVEVGGRRAVGFGAIYLSDLWAWPDPALSHDKRDRMLREFCREIAAKLADVCGPPAHPLELGLRLHMHCAGVGAGWGPRRSHVPAAMPELARAMCASTFDAAIHDAVGRALGTSAFEFYQDADAMASADTFFPKSGACRAIRRMLLSPPRMAFDAWLVVGKDDSLDRDLAPWVRERGYHAFKLKTLGRDPAADAGRTVELYRWARRAGVAKPRISIDSNEGNPDAASVAEYLDRVRAADREAFDAIEYLEQPTSRDIELHRFDWREVARRKPVVLDEGLVELATLRAAVEQGWSGIAIKTCKGHSFCLAAAAWAHEHGMVVTIQDLTNPGIALIHSALLAAHVPSINGVELNSPQFTPEANAKWLPRLGALFEPHDGVHRISLPMPVGLGSRM